jgi:hypothetical protein
VWDDFTTTGVTVGQGAHIVVGVVNNPVTLMCHQSGLTLREMNSSQCDLIDAVTGKLLEQPLDEGVNSLFNAALDDSAKWRKGKKAREDESLLLRYLHFVFVPRSQRTIVLPASRQTQMSQNTVAK